MPTNTELSPILAPNQRIVGDKTISSTLIPFMREREVQIRVRGLKPNSRLYAFFDGIEVTDDMKIDGGEYGDALFSSAQGLFSGVFRVPNRPGKQIRTGSRIFRLTDSQTNRDNSYETYAEAIFTAAGVLDTRQRSVISTRTVTVPTPPTIIVSQIVPNAPIPSAILNNPSFGNNSPVQPTGSTPANTGSTTTTNPLSGELVSVSLPAQNVQTTGTHKTFTAAKLDSIDYIRFTVANTNGKISITTGIDRTGVSGISSGSIRVYQNNVLKTTISSSSSDVSATQTSIIDHVASGGTEYKIEFSPTSIPTSGTLRLLMDVVFPGTPEQAAIRSANPPVPVLNFVPKTEIITFPRSSFGIAWQNAIIFKKFTFRATSKSGTNISFSPKFLERNNTTDKFTINITQKNDAGVFSYAILTVGNGETKSVLHDPSLGREYSVSITKNPGGTFNSGYLFFSQETTMRVDYVADELISPPPTALDPLAQSFTIDTPNGGYVTAVQLFFQQKDVKGYLTARVELREMQNGFPTKNVIPGGISVLSSDQIIVSNDASAATNFAFAHPIYIQPGIEYCFVIKADSPDFKVWVAQLGETDVRTQTKISKQPSTGVMFRSSNDSSWIPDAMTDVSFNLMIARFTETSGTLSVNGNIPANENKNDEFNPFITVLLDNPFFTEEGSNKVVVYHKSHDFRIGDTVTFHNTDNVSGNTYNGIPIEEFSVDHTIIESQTDHYTFETTSNATISGFCGGSGLARCGIVATQHVAFDKVRLIDSQITLPYSNITWDMTAKSFDTNVSSVNRIDPNKEIWLDATKVVIEEDDVEFVATLKSSDSYISPVIDLERISAVFSRDRINAGLVFGKKYHTDLSLPSDRLNTQDIDNSVCKYVTKAIELELSANSLRVYLEANVRDTSSFVDGILVGGSAILVYGRFLANDSTKSIAEIDWIPLIQKNVVAPNTNITQFSEYEFDINSAALESYGISEYNVFQVKIVLLATNTARSPNITNFRAIATLE